MGEIKAAAVKKFFAGNFVRAEIGSVGVPIAQRQVAIAHQANGFVYAVSKRRFDFEKMSDGIRRNRGMVKPADEATWKQNFLERLGVKAFS